MKIKKLRGCIVVYCIFIGTKNSMSYYIIQDDDDHLYSSKSEPVFLDVLPFPLFLFSCFRSSLSSKDYIFSILVLALLAFVLSGTSISSPITLSIFGSNSSIIFLLLLLPCLL